MQQVFLAAGGAALLLNFGQQLRHQAFQASPLPVVFLGLTMGLGALVILRGVRAIERVSLVLLPTLLVIVILAVVRADHDVNEGKVKDAVGGAVGLANENEARMAGFAIGYVSPRAILAMKDKGATLVVVDVPAAGDAASARATTSALTTYMSTRAI